MTIRDLIHEPTPCSKIPEDGLMLVEDIQLGLCSMHSYTWRLQEQLRYNPNVDSDNKGAHMHTLMTQLESWKRLLYLLPIQCSDLPNLSQEARMAMRFYHGFEDHSEVGWQSIVFARPKSLHFDALMLYHLSSLHACLDIKLIHRIAKERSYGDALDVYGASYCQERTRRMKKIRELTLTPNMRRALYHSACTLVLYNSLSDLEKQTVDPITYIVLSVGALVIWAYCTFVERGCGICALEPGLILPSDIMPAVELTMWTETRNKGNVQGRDCWIDKGGGLVLLMGSSLCRCNQELLTSNYRQCIPDDWDLAKYIFPF